MTIMTNRRNARNDYDSHFNIAFSLRDNSALCVPFRLTTYCVIRDLLLFNKFIQQFRIVVAVYKTLHLFMSFFLTKSEIA